MKLYKNFDLHGMSVTLDDNHVFQVCNIEGANINTAGFGLSIEGCYGTTAAPEFVVDGIVRQL